MRTTLNILIDKMEVLYENIYHLLIAFQKSTNSGSSKIDVPIKDPNTGVTTTVTIDSITDLKSEINRISNNFKAMTNNGDTQVVNADGSISTFKRVSFVNAEYIDMEDITIGDRCYVDNRSILNDFVHPLVKVPIIINDSKLISNTIVARTYQITNGYDSIPTNVTYTEFNRLINNGTVTADQENVRELQTVREQVIYHGKFDVKQVEYTASNDTYTVVLNDLKYTGINVIGDSIELKVGDELVKEDGSISFTIQSISVYNNTVVLKIKNGAGQLDASQKLIYNQKLSTTDEHTIGLPVKPVQNIVVFFSTLSDNAVSFPSNGVKISTKDYKVVHRGTEYTIDEFYSLYVTNITEFIKSIVEQNQIPLSAAIVPNAPTLHAANFKVAQVNRHMTNTVAVKDINTLNSQKATLQNQIDIHNQSITDLQAQLNVNNYNNLSDKNEIIKKIDDLRQTIVVLEQQLLGVARRIDSEALNNRLGTIKSKFKVFGYWNVDNPYSPITGIQKIIRYDVQYRYLNMNTDDINATTIKMVDNGKEVSVSFSPWNTLPTETLQKVRDNEGKMVWDTVRNDAVDDLAINQCMITINENESVEIRVRAVSEAGYPISPVKSEWSNIVRINFPEYLRQTEINNTVDKNAIDLRLAEYNNVLHTRGVISHISGQITEADKVFHHTANFITSGQYDQNMRNIPLDICISDIIRDIKILKENDNRQHLYVSVVDHLGNIYEVGNNQLVSINVNRQNAEYKNGQIIREALYIKIKNRNNIPVSLATLQPINMDRKFLDMMYREVPVLYKHKEENNGVADYYQKPGQVLYFRSRDMSLHSSLRLYNANAYDPPVTKSGQNDEKYKAFNELFPSNNHEVDNENNSYQINTVINTSEGNYDAVYFKLRTDKSKYLKLYKNITKCNTDNVFLTGRYYKYNTIPRMPKNLGTLGMFSTDDNDWKTLTEIGLDNWANTQQCEDHIQMTRFTSTLVTDKQDIIKVDPLYADNDILEYPYRLGFTDTVEDMIGVGTCGAFLYPKLSIGQHFVRGTESGSTYTMFPNEEITIPVIFEYRFTDAFGHRNGLNTTAPFASDPLRDWVSGSFSDESFRKAVAAIINNNNVSRYSKTLGISMIMDRSLFLFDLNVNVNF